MTLRRSCNCLVRAARGGMGRGEGGLGYVLVETEPRTMRHSESANVVGAFWVELWARERSRS